MKKRKKIFMSLLIFFMLLYSGAYLRLHRFNYSYPLGKDRTIAIVTFGNNYSNETIQYTQELLESVFKVTTKVIRRPFKDLKPVYNPVRDQFDASILLNTAHTDKEGPYFRTLLLLNQDIYCPGYNHIYLLSKHPPSDMVVVSTNRYEKRIGKLILDRLYYKKILRSMVLQALGHTLGLMNCQNHCVMKPSKKIYHFIRKSDRYCDLCEKKIDQTLSRSSEYYAFLDP